MKRWWLASTFGLLACLDAEGDFPRAPNNPCAAVTCPAEMSPVVEPDKIDRPRGGLVVEGQCVCVDRYEASAGPDGAARSLEGVRPWVGVSFQAAQAACAKAGKRLCTGSEWTAACTGLPALPFPYGPELDRRACNTTATVAMTGSYQGCEGGVPGLYDLSGNVAEWAAEPTLGTGCDPELGCAVFGGGPKASDEELACGYRAGLTASESLGGVGFRCCQSP